MPPKPSQSVTNLTTNATSIISDLLTSHLILAPNEYSSATIGIHSCLLRCFESEHCARYFYQTKIIGLRTQDFINHLNHIEKKSKNDCQLSIERCSMIARLCRWLKINENKFENILDLVKDHLNECMREDAPLLHAQTYEEFIQQCHQRNQMAFEYDKFSRMRRFQFHDQKENKQSINLINLQTWTQQHFETLVNNIIPDSPNHTQLLTELQDLLNNSFFIIQHPTRVATHSPTKNETVTAKINCRLLCLLDQSHPSITIDNITPFIRCLTRLNPTDEYDVSYQQSQIEWKTYSFVTALNNRRIFSCADLSEIILNPISAIPQGQQSSIGKAHYAPFLYQVDFHINITIRFPSDQSSRPYCVIVQSTPFGLITNTSQEEELFAKVFIEHLKHWKSMKPSTTMDLTIEDIIDSIKRYFIHKTGIFPKPWIMPYIQNQLKVVYNNVQNSMDNQFYDILAKILAQIDFMTKHPLLILFHDDGFFFGICDSKLIRNILLGGINRCEKAICALRFGSIHNMPNTKNIGVRIDLLDKSVNDIQNCTFDPERLPLDLGSFITRIASYQATCFENVVYNISRNTRQQVQIDLKNIRVFAELYDSEKLRELCPPQKYSPIWTNFDSKENKKPTDCNSSSMSNMPQNFTMTTTNTPYNINPLTSNQSQQIMQLHQPQYYQMPQYFPQTTYSNILQSEQQYSSPSQVSHQIQPVYTTFSDILQSSMTSLNYSENNQQRTGLTSVIIIYAPVNQSTMSDQDVVELISERFPQYSSSIPFDHIHHLNLNSLSQSSNIVVQPSQDSFSDLTSTSSSSDQSMLYETFMKDLTDFSDTDNNN